MDGIVSKFGALKCPHCGEWFLPQEFNRVQLPMKDYLQGTMCEHCNGHLCPHCQKCLCQLSEEGRRVARTMQEQYLMNLKMGVVKDALEEVAASPLGKEGIQKIVFQALNNIKLTKAVCLNCENEEEYPISRLPLSGSLHICPECGESEFQLWKR